MSIPTVTLDELARHPAKAVGLSAETRAALIVQAASVLAVLGAGMMPQSEDTTPDRLLTVKETAERLRLSGDYVYRHARSFPFFVQPNGGRAVRFSERGIARYLRQQQEQQSS
jgi:predicted DNA-binding transcriptional regulator AlpA